ncbi:hypothetical protein [Novosphingobium sp. 9U]|uniref:hypothetical protein n=1 Tax=Novosphingobium sp. 9U TaxID=2653158 RepID=UPI0012F33B9E|nr:hypothetical protein [Novosphingobium sp. 9U]VWX46556.1 conserved hypothetical protein [Novosphingobium sp. 9U]
MNLTRDRVHSIGWMTVLLICGALSLALMLRVNAVRSQVAGSEKRIAYLQRDIDFLQTEFQTRSNQQQLKTLNDVEFGYEAPRAEQYIEGERQLAALGKAPAPGAPQPIRYASAKTVNESDGAPAGGLLAMVSPVTGVAPAQAKTPAHKPAADAKEKDEAVALARDARSLRKRLARIELASDVQ